MAKITNEMKYKTADDRVRAFIAYCKNKKECDHDSVRRDCPKLKCMMEWLALEAEEEEKPEPCFYCSNKTHIDHSKHDDYSVLCDHCGYRSEVCKTKKDAISKHNRTCKAVATYVANGGAKDKMLADMLNVCDILCPGHGGFEEKCLNCKCKALCDKYHSLQLEISEYREKVERESEVRNG